MGFSLKKCRHGVSLSALFITAIIMLQANPFANETIGPFDLLTRFPGWHNTGFKLPVVHHQHSDVLDYKLPAWHYFKQQIRQGKLPLWNVNVMGGEPGIQMPVRSFATPAFFIYTHFANEGQGLYAASLINLLILSVGCYFFLFSLYPTRFAAFIGTVVFTYCGFNAAWFYWHHVNTSIWIPWLMFFCIRYLDTLDKKFLPWLTLASALMILGGFPIVSVYAYIALALLLLTRYPSLSGTRKERCVILLKAPLFIALSLLVCAYALQPLAEFILRTNISYRQGGTSLKLNDLLLFLSPDAYGRPQIEKALYVGIMPVLLLIPSLWIAWRNRYDWRIIWALSLLVFSIPLAFALLPNDWIRQIPVIGKNPWNRLVLLTALGLSVITSCVIYHFQSKTKEVFYKSVVVLLMALSVWQVTDQYIFFKNFVGPAPAESIYPVTKTIQHVKKQSAPMQSILHDWGFLINGTLSYYLLADWYAHGLRSEDDKVILNLAVFEPFKTASAASIDCNRINFSEPVISYLNIRYILCTKQPSDGFYLLGVETMNLPDISASANLNTHTAVQHFRLPLDMQINQLEVEIDPDRTINAKSVLHFLIMQNNKELSRATCLAEELKKSITICKFNPELELKIGAYTLHPRFESVSTNEKIVIRQARSEWEDIFITTDGKRENRIFRLRLSYQRESVAALNSQILSNKNRYLISKKEPGVWLIENREVSGSAYFLPDLVYGAIAEYKTVALENIDDSEITLNYHGNKSGWIILPMRKYPGWQAYIDDKPAATETFLQVLPAIAVTGPARITYQYIPWYFYISCIISLIGLSLTFYLMWRYQR